MNKTPDGKTFENAIDCVNDYYAKLCEAVDAKDEAAADARMFGHGIN